MEHYYHNGLPIHNDMAHPTAIGLVSSSRFNPSSRTFTDIPTGWISDSTMSLSHAVFLD